MSASPDLPTPALVPAHSAGTAWVQRFLAPLLAVHFAHRRGGLHCLQIWADDDDEAATLRAQGHHCVVFMPQAADCDAIDWYAVPVRSTWPPALPFADASFDLVFTSAFPRLAQTATLRAALADDLARVLRPGGAMLLYVGNRYCPFDLHDRHAFVHGPWHREKASLVEVEQAFAGTALRLQRLSLAGLFGWRRVPTALQWLARSLEAYISLVSAPQRRWLYQSGFNTGLLFWVVR